MIKDEFEKACLDYATIELKAGRTLDVPLFAAKWVAEYIASRMVSTTNLAMEIRQFSKELT